MERQSHSHVDELSESLVWTSERLSVSSAEPELHASSSFSLEQQHEEAVQALSTPQSPVPPVVSGADLPDIDRPSLSPGPCPQQVPRQAGPQTDPVTFSPVPAAMGKTAIHKSDDLTPSLQQALEEAMVDTPPQSYTPDAELEADPVIPRNSEDGKADIRANETAADEDDDADYSGTYMFETR